MRAATPSHSVPSPGCTSARTERVQGGGWVIEYNPWGGLGHREAWRIHAIRHPPGEPALYHHGSPTVAGEGWGTRSRNRAAAARLGRPPDCVPARRTHPPRSTPTPR